MPVRISKEVLYLRHDFSAEEKLQMGSELAAAYNRRQQIDEEAKVIKSQLNDRISQVEATIGSLSRNLASGFDMRNVDCRLSFDEPNVGEVTYYGPDGKSVKVRPMTETERQMDLPLPEPKTEAEAETSAEKSAANIEGFFKGGNQNDGEEEPEQDHDEEPSEGDEDDEEAEFATAAAPAKKSGPAELKAFHEKESKKGRKKAPTEPF